MKTPQKAAFRVSGFRFFLSLSAAGHILVFALLFVGDFKRLFYRDIAVSSGVKVSLSASPAFPRSSARKKTLPKPAVKNRAKVQKPKPAIKNKPKKREKISETAPPVQPPEKKSAPEADSKEEALADGVSEEENPSSDPEEGNRLSEERMSALRGYLQAVEPRVRSNLNLPKHLAEKDFYVQVEVRLNLYGGFLSKRLFVSSGNELFDRLVLKAVQEAAPFPPPPDNLRGLIGDGIVFGVSSRD